MFLGELFLLIKAVSNPAETIGLSLFGSPSPNVLVICIHDSWFLNYDSQFVQVRSVVHAIHIQIPLLIATTAYGIAFSYFW